MDNEFLFRELPKVLLEFVSRKQNLPPLPSTLLTEEHWANAASWAPDTNGLPLTKLTKKVSDEFVDFCSNPSAGGFLRYPYNGTSISGFIGICLAALLQQNMVDYRYSQSATLIDAVLLRWLRRISGYICGRKISNVLDFGGVFTASGTTSNTISLLAARKHWYDKNNNVNNGPVLVIPEKISHYGVRMAADWLGYDSVVEVESAAGQFKRKSLEETLQRFGARVGAVVAFSGNSRTFEFENLVEVRRTLDFTKSSAWLHCDAAHGFQLLFHKKEKLHGLDHCDSITFDAHKIFGLPFGCSAALFREPTNLRLLAEQNIEDGEYSTGLVTPFMSSRSWHSLPLYMHVMENGMSGIKNRLRQRFLKAEEIASRIDNIPGFLTIRTGDLPSIFFTTQFSEDYSTHNQKAILRALADELRPQIDTAIVDLGCTDKPEFCIRLVIGHNYAQIDVDKLVRMLQECSPQ